ncbi:MAG: hypothetical protein V7K77_13025 [Nostoc sp.]
MRLRIVISIAPQVWKFKDILTELKRSPPSEPVDRILHNDTNAFNVLPERRSLVDLHFKLERSPLQQHHSTSEHETPSLSDRTFQF